MAKKIIIHLTGTEKVSWLIADENGSTNIKPLAEDDLATIATQCKQLTNNNEYEIIVIVPGIDVLLTQVTLPNIQRKGLSATVGYALEEQLIQEVENYYFGIPDKVQANISFPVAIVLKEKLQSWIDQLKTNSIQAHRLIPETLAIRYEINAWHIYLDTNTAIIRTGENSGYVIDRQLLEIVLKEEFEKPDQIKPARILLTNVTKKSAKFPKLPILVEKLTPKNILEQTASLTIFPLNLLQPEQQPKQKKGRAQKIWQTACYLLIACIVINILSIIISYFSLAHQNTALQRQIAAIYVQNFPGATAVDDPGAQMEKKLDQLESAASGGNFLQLLAKSGSIIRQYGIIQNLSYENRQLQLDLKLNNPTDKNELISALQQRNLTLTSSEKNGLLHLIIGGK